MIREEKKPNECDGAKCNGKVQDPDAWKRSKSRKAPRVEKVFDHVPNKKVGLQKVGLQKENLPGASTSGLTPTLAPENIFGASGRLRVLAVLAPAPPRPEPIRLPTERDGSGVGQRTCRVSNPIQFCKGCPFSRTQVLGIPVRKKKEPDRSACPRSLRYMPCFPFCSPRLFFFGGCA